MKNLIFLLTVSLILFNCGRKQTLVELKHFPITNIDEVLSKSEGSIDTLITSDGNGSLLVEANKPMVVRLFEIKKPNVENAQLLYQAKVKTENVEGKVYLEIWCGFTGLGEFFSRGLYNALSGTKDWTTLQAPFFLKKGQNPDFIKLNIVIEGKGKVWIDDVHLFKGPIK